MIVMKNFNALLLVGLMSCSVLSGCNSGSQSNSGGSSSSTALTIDNSSTIPVFTGSSTSSKIYIHNNTGTPINNIKYSVSDNLQDAGNKFTLLNTCSSIAAHSVCGLEFKTPLLSKSLAQGSAIINASYQLNGEEVSSSQLLNYATVSSSANGVFFSSDAAITKYNADGVGYVTAYMYASGIGQKYTIDKLDLSNSSFRLSASSLDVIGTTIASSEVVAVEVSTNKDKSVVSTDLTVAALNQSSAVASSNTAVVVGSSASADGAILIAGEVPLINVANGESGQMQVLNAGNAAASITAITPPSGVTLVSGSNQCNTVASGLGTLESGASCNIYFTVNQSGGSGNMVVTYTGSSNDPAILTQTITWYNPVGGVLLQMTANPSLLNFTSGSSESTTITVTNVGGYNLTNVTVPVPTTNGSATIIESTALVCSAGGNSLPVNGSCSYSMTVSDSVAETNAMLFGISGQYTNESGAQTYGRVLAVAYVVESVPSTNKIIFVSSNGYLGNFAQFSSTNSGVNGADIACESEAAAGGLSGTFKALLVAESRYPCDSSGSCGVGHNRDWPVAANTQYFTTAESAFMMSDANGIFESTMPQNALLTPAQESAVKTFWSGVNYITAGALSGDDLQTLTAWYYALPATGGATLGADATCANWTSGSTGGGWIGNAGSPENEFAGGDAQLMAGASYNIESAENAVTPFLISSWVNGSMAGCKHPQSLVCIQQ